MNALFVLLMLLVSLDLAFVHATDVVPPAQLLPLWVLTASSVWLRRLQRHASYRRVWNTIVLALFALLVHHATTTGLLHMLEDGLVLAVLCQVHLLNNVGDRQRPDLVFFNSFLIAFVTSFFAPDVVWSVLFVVHAFVLVPSLQLHSLLRRRPSIDPAVVRFVLRDSVPRTIGAAALATMLFVVLPRDFRREGWLGDTMLLHDPFDVAAAQQIRIGDEHMARLDDTIVAHLRPASARPDDVPAHWRTSVFSSFDGSVWSPQDVAVLGSRFATDPPWNHQPDGSWRRDVAPDAATSLVHVRLDDPSARCLPTPLGAVRLSLPDVPGRIVDAKSTGCFTLLDTGTSGRAVEYDVDVAASAGLVPPSPRTRQHFTALPEHLPAAMFALAEQLHASLPADADARTIAHAATSWLQDNRRYQLPGNPGFARNLGEFMLGSGAGHCEYFATALALLLRLQDVPCRVAGGFLAHEWDDEQNAIVLRNKHAHAWVEVLAEDGAWHTFDATPAADVASATAASESWWADVRAELERWWSSVAGFDRAAQARWLAAAAALPREHPFALGAVLAIAVTGVWLRRRRRQHEPAIRELQRAIRAASLSLRPGETPRELLARAKLADVAPRLLARLAAATRQHEDSRYRTAPARPVLTEALQRSRAQR